MKKLCAFTLAETLITLMIIGVIAAVTIPTIKDHSDEAKYVALAKKAHASVQNAAGTIEARHTDMAFWDCGTKTRKWFQEVLNTIPYTGPETWDHLALSGSAPYGWDYYADFLTADGMTWIVTGTSGKCDVRIDVNGPSEPNVTGIDQVAFRVGLSDNGVDYGVFPRGTPGHAPDSGWCTYRILQTGKMPWLRDVGKVETCAAY